MNIKPTVKQEVKDLNIRIRGLLPLAYHSCLEAISPTSMGSAGLKYDKEGMVAWDEIWTTFCDLAMAGGPPHRGKFLGPTNPADVSKDPEKSKAMPSEIMRGIQLTTGMKASIDDEINWVLLECESETMAAWMHRAIVAENVFADHLGKVVRLPSGPDFRIEKEIKNVIVCVAKTWHYWDGHMSENEKAKAGKVMNDAPAYAKAAIETLETIGAALKFEGKTASEYGWVGFECPDEKSAAWMVRAIIACNILARREITTLLLPVFIAPVSDYPLARMFDFLTAIRNVYEHQLEIDEV
ncbi:MAG: hypothetical protein NTZ30_12925 [Planctomycetota bacterium]|nr:hypothetical protein [Planctomycetota bacterium]